MSVTTTYKWGKYIIETTYPITYGAFGTWSSYYDGDTYSGNTDSGFDNSTGTFTPNDWQSGSLYNYYNTFYSGSGSSITETEVEFIYVAGDGSKYRERSRTLSAGTPTYSQGAYIEQATSTTRTAYPDNGEYLGRWYVYTGYTVTTDSTYSYIKTNCSNGNNGTITASASGGSGSHLFKLMKGTSTISSLSATYQFTGLSAGTYTLYGKDAQATNIEYTEIISIVAAASFTISKTNCSAYGSNDGTIAAYGTSGSGSYQYKLLLGATILFDWSSTASFTTLAAGIYTLKCRDASYTSVETTLTTTVLSPPQFSYVKTDNTSASTPNGTITASGIGGSGSYLFSVNGGAAQSSGEFTGLSAQTYTLLCAEQGGLATQRSFSVTVLLSNQSNLMIGESRYRLFVGDIEYGFYVGDNRII